MGKSSSPTFVSPFESQTQKPSAVPGLPTADQDPWGGPDPSHWQPEAIQTNVSIALGDSWNQTELVLIATLTKFNGGSSKIKLCLHRSLTLPAQNASLTYTRSGTQVLLKFNKSRRSKSGDFEFELRLKQGEGPAWDDVFESHVAFVQLENFKDWFPIDFRDVVKDADDMLSPVPPELRNLGKGTLLDSENVNARDKSADHFPSLGMADPNFGQDIQADRDFPVPGSRIHNEYPRANGENRITSVGHGNTLVMIKAMLHFSVMPTHGPSMRPRWSQFPLVRLSLAARICALEWVHPHVPSRPNHRGLDRYVEREKM